MKADPPDKKARLPLHPGKEVIRVARSLAEQSMGIGSRLRQDYPFASQSEFDVPLAWVEWLISARRTRARYLTSELFADPAWDILLDLLRAEIAHERISVSSACIAAAVPTTTGLRWLGALERHGLVVRQCDLHDARRTFVVLSEETSKALRRYFLEVVGAPPSNER